MWQEAIKKVRNNLRYIVFAFLFVFITFSSELSASFLQSSTILNHKAYDIGFAVPIVKYPYDNNVESQYGSGFGIRSGFGLYDFMDVNFSLAKWGNLKPLAAFELRFGLPKDKDIFYIRPTLSFGIGYSRYESTYTSQTNLSVAPKFFNMFMDLLYIPVDFMVSTDVDLGFISFEPYAGFNVTRISIKYISVNASDSLNSGSQQNGGHKGEVDYFYLAKAGIIFSPSAFRITRFVFETQQSLTTFSKQAMGDSYILGIIVSIQALGNTDYINF